MNEEELSAIPYKCVILFEKITFKTYKTGSLSFSKINIDITYVTKYYKFFIWVKWK